MAVTNVTYNASAAITSSHEGLGIGGYQESAAISNTTNLYMDALVSGSIQVGVVTADGWIDIWAYGSVDDGATQYSGGLAGTDREVTFGTTGETSVLGYRNLFFLGRVHVATNDDNNDIEFGPFSVAQAFGGVLPNSWGIVIENRTDIALHATGTNNEINYTGIEFTTV